MKMVTEYLAQAAAFERMASDEQDPTFKEQLLKQAAAYRKLAKEHAAKFNLPRRPPQSHSLETRCDPVNYMPGTARE